MAASQGAEETYTRLCTHVAQVSDDPHATVPDVRLFEEADLILPEYLQGSQQLVEKRLGLMRILAATLTDLRLQDPTPFANLLIKLFDGWTWQQVCEFGTQSVPYHDGLAVGEHMVPFNKLMLALLSKATTNAADAAHAASMLETMQALVRLWLCTTDTGVASQASKLLLDLLKADPPTDLRTENWRNRGQGLVWKRIFADRDVYNVFFEACSLAIPSLTMSKSQKTIAQARLLEWLPHVAVMNWNTVSRTQHIEVETKYGVQNGLLDFAALHMVHVKEDVLMHCCLIDFFSALIIATKGLQITAVETADSVGLAYLIDHEIHGKTVAMYLDPSKSDAVESTFLHGPAANYVATYASQYPEHYVASQLSHQVNQRLGDVLSLSSAKWAHSDAPKHDLHVIASVPRKTLLPITSSPAKLLPSKSTNPDVLNTLATIFHGPEHQSNTYPQNLSTQIGNPRTAEEAATARAIYYQYLASNPTFWRDIAVHAETVALKDLALAALNCLTLVITANWSTTPEFPLPSHIAAPERGHLAVLSPPALEYTIPYLLKPPQTFANLVGGRGDAESAAYKVAMAKFEALRALHSRLAVQVEQTPGEGYEDILGPISKRLVEGPWSRAGEVGGRIATMEL